MSDISPVSNLAKSLRIGRFFSYLCLASIALLLISLVMDVVEYRLMTSSVAAEDSYKTQTASIDQKQQTLASIQMAVSLSTTTFLLMWFFYSYKALSELGAKGLRYSPAWAVGGFFVPILNFVRPFNVTREIWQASDPACLDAHAWKSKAIPTLVALWWAGWIATNIEAIFVVQYIFLGLDTPEKLKSYTGFAIINEILDVFTMTCNFFMINKICAMQAEKGWKLSQAAAQPGTDGL